MKNKNILNIFLMLSIFASFIRPLQAFDTTKKLKSLFSHKHFARYALGGSAGLLTILLYYFCSSKKTITQNPPLNHPPHPPLPNQDELNRQQQAEELRRQEQLAQEQQMRIDEELARQMQNEHEEPEEFDFDVPPLQPVNPAQHIPAQRVIEDVDEDGNPIYVADANAYRAEGPMIDPNAPLTDREREHFRIQEELEAQVQRDLEERARRAREAAAQQPEQERPAQSVPLVDPVAPTIEPILSPEELRQRRLNWFDQNNAHHTPTVQPQVVAPVHPTNMPTRRTETAEEQAERERRAAAFMSKKSQS